MCFRVEFSFNSRPPRTQNALFSPKIQVSWGGSVKPELSRLVSNILNTQTLLRFPRNPPAELQNQTDWNLLVNLDSFISAFHESKTIRNFCQKDSSLVQTSLWCLTLQLSQKTSQNSAHLCWGRTTLLNSNHGNSYEPWYGFWCFESSWSRTKQKISNIREQLICQKKKKQQSPCIVVCGELWYDWCVSPVI